MIETWCSEVLLLLINFKDMHVAEYLLFTFVTAGDKFLY
jgi:hypothetical protein